VTSPLFPGENLLRGQIERIRDRLREGRPLEANGLALRLVESYPDNVDGWIQLGRSYAQLSSFRKSLDAAEKALVLDPRHPTAQLVLIEALLGCGRNGEAVLAARKLEAEREADASVVLQVGYCYTRTNRHSDAARCYERVRVLQPANHAVLHNLAGAYLALGDLAKAEPLYNELLRKEVHAYEAYYNRATLRRQTPKHNHVAEMEKVLSDSRGSRMAERVLCYSLAKELEDLGEWQRAFAYLKRGADSLKRQSSYRVAVDIGMMDEVRRQFDESFFAEPRSGYCGESPIFVLGMPRTGTTLVDRILSSHTMVGSVGESDEFFRTLVRQAHGEGTRLETQRARVLDWESVGSEFCRAINEILPGYGHLLDKTPNNFLYLGLILTALPNAKIVHLRRQPMDTCYAIYKTLFRQAYPYSYDLGDLGRYYLAYWRLMDHWRRLLPGRFLDVDYEDLVENQEDVSRRVVAFCGLDWDDACLSFDRNEAPSLTASAAQVRQRIYNSSVGLWHRYEQELEPLNRILREGCIEIA